MDGETHFWQLCDQATRLDDGSIDAQAFEAPMIGIIDLVGRQPDHRESVVRCFCALVLWKRKAPWMLVPFCMRRLRFPEIPALIAKDADEHLGTAYYAS